VNVSQTLTLPDAVDRVWPLLNDPAVVASCLPGAELDESSLDEGGTYAGAMTVAFGPTRVRFAGRVDIRADDVDHVIHIEASGQDGPGRSRASASGTVSVTGADHATTVAIDGRIRVVGPLATFAEAGGAVVAAQVIESFSACLCQRLSSGAPTDTRDVAGTATPPPVRPLAALLRAVGRWASRRVRNLVGALRGRRRAGAGSSTRG
jgi:carbon monoxide dehydrogenase subunit G